MSRIRIDALHVDVNDVLPPDGAQILVSFHWLFYYVILETKPQVFLSIIQHGKWNSVAKDWSRSYWIYCWPRFRWAFRSIQWLTAYKCKMFSLKNNISVWSSIDRRFFKLILISSFSLFLFDLVFRTTVTLWDWEARWPFRNVYCYFSSWTR